MTIRNALVCAAVASALWLTPHARGQDDCHCDCYFSVDCSGSEICFYGEQGFPVQDECWWRRPKPVSPGAGCNEDHNDWGHCDGKCTSSALAGPKLVGPETPQNVANGVATWAHALDAASLDGGGVPKAEWLRRLDAIPFENPTLSYGLWRMVSEVLMLARGEDYLIFPKTNDGFTLWEVAVADLRGDKARIRNGEVAVKMLLAEMLRPGAGRRFVGELDASRLDGALYERICPGIDPGECLYREIYDMGAVLGYAGTVRPQAAAAQGEITPPCPGCVGDVVYDDAVNFTDLLDLLSHWGQDYPPGDLDGDGMVGFSDLLEVLSRWGPCAP